MMGHVQEWFTTYLAGITLAEVGYDAVNMKPSVIESVDMVKGSVDTVHGRIVSEYQIDENKNMRWRIFLPVGVSAKVYVPILKENQIILLDGREVRTEVTEDEAFFAISEPIMSGEYVVEF